VSNNSKLYKLKDLYSLIQASSNEIIQGLLDLHAVEIDGYWRLIDPKFTHEILDLLLTSAIQHDWSVSQISLKNCISALPDYSELVILNTLQKIWKENKG